MANYTVTVEEKPYQVTVIDTNSVVVEVGVQGPPGLTGSSTFVTETAPTVAAIGDIWYNPTTMVEKFYTASGWQDTSLDGLYF